MINKNFVGFSDPIVFLKAFSLILILYRVRACIMWEAYSMYVCNTLISIIL